ncbi:retropepsin-like aspartic protease, partial [Mycobacterium kansasii]
MQGTGVFLLVDTGSTISMIAYSIVKRLGLNTTPMVGVRVIVAAGTFTDATKLCKNCQINLGGRVVCIDLIVTTIY